MLEEKDIEIIRGLLEENSFKLETRLEAKLEEKLEAKLEEKLEAKLEEKLEAKLEENNLKLEKRLTRIILEEVGEIIERQNEFLTKELAKFPTKEDLFSYVDNKIIPIELDVDRLKYLNKDKWKKLPEQRIINEELIEAGI